MKKLTILFLCFATLGVFGQDSAYTKYRFLKLNYQAGQVFPTNVFVEGQNQKGEPITGYQSGAIEFGVQTNGSKQWHHDWKMPVVGVGLYTADFFNDEELGQPMALYAFFNYELWRKKKFSVNFEGAAGITYNWNPYDPVSNPSNMAIGSYNTVYLDFGGRATYRLSKKWQVDLAYTYTHFSNGASTLPNWGLNMGGPKVALAYHFQGNDPTFYEVANKKEFEKKNEFVLDIKYATKQVKFDTSITKVATEYLGIDYNVWGFSAEYLHQPARKWKYGGGIDLVYDESTTSQLDVVDSIYAPVKTAARYHWNLSVYAAGQMIVGKTSYFVNLGYYVWREEIPGQTPDMYQRFGMRWNLYKKMQIGAALRAYNFGIADYIEWSVGFKL